MDFDLFHTAADGFNEQVLIANGLSTEIRNSTGPAQRSTLLKSAEEALEQMKDTLEQMEQSLPKNAQKEKDIFDQSKMKYENAKRAIQNAEAEAKRAIRDELMSHNDPYDIEEGLDDDSAQLIGNINRTQRRTTDQIRAALAISDDIQETGNRIGTTLRGQRDRLNNILDTTRDATHEVDRAKKSLNELGRNIMKNKLILIGIIVILVLAVVFILYLRFS